MIPLNRNARIVSKLGEQMYLIQGEKRIPFKMSAKESTRATYSQNNRANFFEGQSFKYADDNGTPTEIHLGDYIERACDPLLPYFVASLIPEPLSQDTLVYAYLMRCNAKIDLWRLTKDVDPDDPTHIITVPEDIVTDLWVNKDVTTRSMKSMDSGLLDQAIYIVHLPKSVGAQIGDRLTMKDGRVYRVESVNDTLVNPSMLTGVDILQLTFSDEDNKGGDSDGDIDV